MTDAGSRINVAARPIGNRYGNSLGFDRRIAQAVNQRVTRASENLCCSLNACIHRRRLSLNQTTGSILNFMIEKPGRAKHAGLFCLGDVLTFNMQFNVIANTTTERAGGVLDDLQFGGSVIFGGRFSRHDRHPALSRWLADPPSENGSFISSASDRLRTDTKAVA